MRLPHVLLIVSDVNYPVAVVPCAPQVTRSSPDQIVKLSKRPMGALTIRNRAEHAVKQARQYAGGTPVRLRKRQC